jgi:hypothetical protein
MSPTSLREQSLAAPSSARRETGDRRRLIEQFAPVALVRERHEVAVDAPAELALEVAEGFDLLSIPWVRRIFWLRAKVMRASPPGPDERLGLVAGTCLIGWGELARRPGREVVMGAAVQPWLPEPAFEAVPATDFLSFSRPAHVKIVWTLEAEPRGPDRSLLRTETRVVPTDEEARRKFSRYWLFARAGIVLIRRLVLPAIRREAERRTAAPPSRPLDRALPSYDARLVCETTVDAPPAVAYAAVREADLLDPVVRALFGIREAPARWLARRRGEPVIVSPRSVTVADLLRPGTGMVVVREEEGSDLVIGSVGRFWRRDYGHREVSGEGFTTFDEPGYAKLAMGFEVRPLPGGRALVHYEARTATTDAEARRRFRRYWRVIRPGVRLVMRRALARIRREAERRAAAPG